MLEHTLNNANLIQNLALQQTALELQTFMILYYRAQNGIVF